MKPKGPHTSARYIKTAALFRKYRSVKTVAAELNLRGAQVSQDLTVARRKGLLPPPVQDAERWLTETARISGLTAGTRNDLLNALGVDLVKRIAGECPEGVPLMVYIAGIVKDGYDTV